MANKFNDLSWTPEVKKVIPQHSSKSNEWRTPLDYIDAVNLVIGPIDLDPASSAEANDFINASFFYTEQSNGLVQPWFGRVFLNPPYGDWTGKFVNKLVDEFSEIKRVEEAILLINSNTSTKYWQRAYKSANAICYPSKRIAFIDENGVPRKSPPHPNSIFYFGENADKFSNVFLKFGIVTIL